MFALVKATETLCVIVAAATATQRTPHKQATFSVMSVVRPALSVNCHATSGNVGANSITRWLAFIRVALATSN